MMEIARTFSKDDQWESNPNPHLHQPSPTGASDDAACVGVMMEIARTLIANRQLKLAAPAVFLFNGGEETLSQAANGFMDQSQ